MVLRAVSQDNCRIESLLRLRRDSSQAEVCAILRSEISNATRYVSGGRLQHTLEALAERGQSTLIFRALEFLSRDGRVRLDARKLLVWWLSTPVLWLASPRLGSQTAWFRYSSLKLKMKSCKHSFREDDKPSSTDNSINAGSTQKTSGRHDSKSLHPGTW